MADREVVNKYLAERMGTGWGECGTEPNTVHYDRRNPDYLLSLSDRQELLEWAVDQDRRMCPAEPQKRPVSRW